MQSIVFNFTDFFGQSNNYHITHLEDIGKSIAKEFNDNKLSTIELGQEKLFSEEVLNKIFRKTKENIDTKLKQNWTHQPFTHVERLFNSTLNAILKPINDIRNPEADRWRTPERGQGGGNNHSR